MQGKQPSLTASRAAAHRAVHQVLEGGKIFADRFARSILGTEACAAADREAADPSTRLIRLFIAVRSRFAEESLAAAVSRGVRQAVILGAGFDTFALRNPHAALGLRVFEVDHAATQAWKRERIAQARLSVPTSLTFVPIDFEHQNLSDCLSENGFHSIEPAFFLWLGVVPYLRRDVVISILRIIAGVPESGVVFDYIEPLENYPPERRALAASMAERVAALGEPVLSHFEPAELARELRGLGFTDLEDLGPTEMAVRFFGAREGESVGGAGPHLICVRR